VRIDPNGNRDILSSQESDCRQTTLDVGGGRIEQLPLSVVEKRQRSFEPQQWAPLRFELRCLRMISGQRVETLYEMIYYYFTGMAEEDELLSHLARL
jgi:hypothetical protein